MRTCPAIFPLVFPLLDQRLMLACLNVHFDVHDALILYTWVDVLPIIMIDYPHPSRKRTKEHDHLLTTITNLRPLPSLSSRPCPM